MSHFSVLVVTDTPSDDELALALQPFHEFECTGTDDQFVREIDKMDEARSTWERNRAKEEAEGRTFVDFVEDWFGWKRAPSLEAVDRGGAHKYGFVIADAEGNVIVAVDRTNPNAKWDWHQIGGRFSGALSVYDPRTDRRNWERCFVCGGTGRRDDDLGHEARKADPTYTCNGCSGKGESLKWPTQWVNVPGTNRCRVSDLRLDTLKVKAVAEREAWVRDLMEKTGLNAEDMAAACEIAASAHEAWLALPEPRPRGNEYHAWLAAQGHPYDALAKVKCETLFDMPEPAPGQTLDQWIGAAPALSSFAVLADGKWHERGEMGWFACVSNEKDRAAWQGELEAMIASLSPEKWLTMVDCHI